MLDVKSLVREIKDNRKIRDVFLQHVVDHLMIYSLYIIL